MAVMTAKLDLAFHALANSTRRAVVERLRDGPATVTELAEPFKMALPSFLQHLQVLETSGLVRSWKRGRVRTVRIVPDQLRQASGWLEKQRSIWERRLDQLNDYVRGMDKQ
jgi:DNA-binding transcriptional ArsR family regulator